MFGIAAFSEAPFSSLAGQTVIVSITGVSATGSVGTAVATRQIAENGNSATGSVGTVTMGARTVALTGVSASGAAGNVTETNSKAEDSVLASGFVGTASPATSIALSGEIGRAHV